MRENIQISKSALRLYIIDIDPVFKEFLEELGKLDDFYSFLYSRYVEYCVKGSLLTLDQFIKWINTNLREIKNLNNLLFHKELEKFLSSEIYYHYNKYALGKLKLSREEFTNRVKSNLSYHFKTCLDKEGVEQLYMDSLYRAYLKAFLDFNKIGDHDKYINNLYYLPPSVIFPEFEEALNCRFGNTDKMIRIYSSL